MNDYSLSPYLVRKKKSRARENRRKRQLPPFRLHWSWYVGAALVVLGLGGAADAIWSLLTHYAAQHPYFAIQDITVKNDGRFSAEQIRTWSALKPGMSLWEIDPKQVEAHLLAQPWIHTAHVRREFPHRMHVAVGIRRPVAIIVREPFTYLDDTGAYFVPQERREEIDLPYISGLENIPLDTPVARAVLTDVVPLLSLVRLWREPLSEIHWDQSRGYLMFLMNRRVTIHLGTETTPEKFAQVRAVLETWPVDRPAAFFDVRFAHQVIVRPQTSGQGRSRTQDPTRRPL